MPQGQEWMYDSESMYDPYMMSAMLGRVAPDMYKGQPQRSMMGMNRQIGGTGNYHELLLDPTLAAFAGPQALNQQAFQPSVEYNYDDAPDEPPGMPTLEFYLNGPDDSAERAIALGVMQGRSPQSIIDEMKQAKPERFKRPGALSTDTTIEDRYLKFGQELLTEYLTNQSAKQKYDSYWNAAQSNPEAFGKETPSPLMEQFAAAGLPSPLQQYSMEDFNPMLGQMGENLRPLVERSEELGQQERSMGRRLRKQPRATPEQRGEVRQQRIAADTARGRGLDDYYMSQARAAGGLRAANDQGRTPFMDAMLARQRMLAQRGVGTM
jgi:hypothetical protein